jgi:peptidyl-prolyl cis-trans isomerase D
MLDFVRKITHGWIAKLILILVTVPFVLFGIETYLKNVGSSAAVAKVSGAAPITIQEYNVALQNLRVELQKQGQKDLAFLESLGGRRALLDRLLSTRLLAVEAADQKFTVSDAHLRDFIVNLPEFQENGKFSQTVYDKLLSANQLTPSQFEQKIRLELITQQIRDSIPTLVNTSAVNSNLALQAEFQQRDVSVVEFKASEYLDQVKVSESEVKAFYDKNKDKFKMPAQVKIEFLTFSASNLIPKMQVTDDELKRFYQDNADKIQNSEQRHASHILLAFTPGSDDKAKQEVKKKAEQVLAEVKKSPTKFAELAKKYSQDPGSAQKGGDLGSFGRGTMVKPFEEAVFSMKPGQVSELVQSDFGYHIIKLIDVSGQGQSFDAMKPQLRADLLYQKALSKFSEDAENFSNIVYEQSGSLKPAADKFGLQVQTSGLMSYEEGGKLFKSDKLMSLVFSDEAVKDKRNTEAVEVGPNTLVSARVLEYKPTAPKTFDDVKGGIEQYLKLQKAGKLAIEKGKASLAKLNKGDASDKLDWIPTVTVDRKNAQGLTDLAMRNAFSVDASKLPAFKGVEDAQKGFLIIKVLAVHDQLTDDASVKETAEKAYRAALAEEYSNAYIASLTAKNKVKINDQLLMSNSDAQQ